MSVVYVDDIAIEAGRPISDNGEIAQVEQWIADVEMILTARLGDLSTVANQPLLSYVIRQSVVARMKFREDRNSDAAQQQQGVGQNFFLGVLRPWWALFDLGDTVDGSTAFTIRPSFTPDCTPADSCLNWDYLP